MVVPTIGDQQGTTIVHVNRERTILAVAAFRSLGKIAETTIDMVSLWSDGRVVSTTNARPRLVFPPGFETVHRVGASVPELVSWHQEFLGKITQGKPLELDEVAQRQLLLDSQHHVFEHHRQRGVWSPLSWAQAEKMTAKCETHKSEEPAREAWR